MGVGCERSPERELARKEGSNARLSRDEEVEEAFQAFYTREFRAVVGLAFVLSGSRAYAEDLAQEAFLAAFRNWEKISSYDRPDAWIKRVVSNRATSHLRRRLSEAKALLRISGQPANVPEIPIDAAEVWKAMRRLPPRQRQVVALRYFDQQSVAEIALVLDCSENTVKTHLRRAKQALAQLLDEEE